MANTVKNYTVYNLTLTNADTEYSQAISESRCYVRVHSADLTASARIAFTSAALSTGEMIFAGAEWHTPEPFAYGAKTIYLRTPNAGAIFQIIVFEID
jgi:hypothetical protein